jgi:hypothetical protein
MNTLWVQVLAFVFLLMTIAPLTLQMYTETQREERTKGEFKGFPGASSASWRGWGPRPSNKKPTKNQQSLTRQSAYKEELRNRMSRRLH